MTDLVTAEQLHVIRQCILHEVARELAALRDTTLDDGTLVFSDNGRQVVEILSAYMHRWAAHADKAPSWEADDEHNCGCHG